MINRRDRPVARLVPIERSMTPFRDRAALRAQLPPMTEPADAAVRSLRDEERF